MSPTPSLPGPVQSAVDAGASVVSGAAGAAGAARRQVAGLIPGADAAQSAVDAVVALRRWISDRHNWTRAAWGLSGVALVIAGVGWLAAPVATPAAAKVVKAVT